MFIQLKATTKFNRRTANSSTTPQNGYSGVYPAILNWGIIALELHYNIFFFEFGNLSAELSQVRLSYRVADQDVSAIRNQQVARPNCMMYCK